MKIAFIHTHDTNDKNLWSGSVFYLYQNLLKQFENVLLFRPTDKNFRLIRIFFNGSIFFLKKISGRECLNIYNSYLLPKILSRRVDRFVRRNEVDLIISTINTPFIFTENKIPLVIITDATVRLLYEEYSEGTGWSELFYNTLEKNALKVTRKSDLIVASSTTTASSLIIDYKIPASKIVVIPFGANIDNEDIEQHQRLVSRDKQVNFLFIGKEWKRKGGDFTVSVCDELIRMGTDVNLTVVGCKVPETSQRTYIKNFGYLDKNKKEDFVKLRELYREAHFFMVFSEAEMYGIVFCEAAAYGLPVVTYAVGGINDIVVDGKTGIMLPKGTGLEVFASRIKTLILDPAKYKHMSTEARGRYETLLNWTSFMKSLKVTLNERITQDSFNV